MDLKETVKKLISICKKEYGRNWTRLIAIKQGVYFSNASSYSHRDNEHSDLEDDEKYDKFIQVLEHHGYDIVGAGGSRLCFGYKNIVIKIDHDKEYGNKEEIKIYNGLQSSLYAKYFTCPLIKKIKINKYLALVYPKVDVSVNVSCRNHNKKMFTILRDLFSDMYECNVGVFCDGLVAIDLNCGYINNEWSDWDNKLSNKGKIKARKFAKKYSKFWKNYIKNYKITVKNIKKECNINI